MEAHKEREIIFEEKRQKYLGTPLNELTKGLWANLEQFTKIF